jgi:hypothetical protein
MIWWKPGTFSRKAQMLVIQVPASAELSARDTRRREVLADCRLWESARINLPAWSKKRCAFTRCDKMLLFGFSRQRVDSYKTSVFANFTIRPFVEWPVPGVRVGEDCFRKLLSNGRLMERTNVTSVFTGLGPQRMKRRSCGVGGFPFILKNLRNRRTEKTV